MQTQKSGWRAMPMPFVIGFAATLVFQVFRGIWTVTRPLEQAYSARVMLTGEGLTFANQILLLVGVLELVRRSAGPRARALRLALGSLAFVIATDLLFGLVQFTSDPWEHRWIWQANEYASVLGWNLFALGLALAAPAARRVSGFVAVGVAFVCWLPPVLREQVWSLLGFTPQSASVWKLEIALRLVRVGALLWLAAAASEGETSRTPSLAAEGFRTAGKALWIRVIAVVVVVVFTLMLMMGGARGGASGAMSTLKVLMMGQAVFSVGALTLFGIGVLRVVRAGLPEMMAGALTVGGAASLWAAGVTLAQLPHVYSMLYRGRLGADVEMEWANVMAVALPIIVVAGVGIVGTALAGYGARCGNDELRSEAQGKGIGFVGLMLVSIAIQNWMIPKASSVGTYAMLALLAAAAGLWATVLMARLFTQAAGVLEREPVLPGASVVQGAN